MKGNKEKLLKRLTDAKTNAERGPSEMRHEAEVALLDFIGDDDVNDAFQSVITAVSKKG